MCISAKINKLSYYSVITGVAKSCPLRVFVCTQRSFSPKFNLTPSKILSLKMSAVLDTLHLIICNKTDGRDVHKYLKIVFSWSCSWYLKMPTIIRISCTKNMVNLFTLINMLMKSHFLWNTYKYFTLYWKKIQLLWGRKFDNICFTISLTKGTQKSPNINIEDLIPPVRTFSSCQLYF